MTCINKLKDLLFSFNSRCPVGLGKLEYGIFRIKAENFGKNFFFQEQIN